MDNKRVTIARAEYIEVEPNVRVHITDAGEGRPIVLIPGWPLSDEMYEYQYNDLIRNNFRVIGITLRGFGKSDKPYGKYDYDVHATDIRKILNQLQIENAVLGGFSMGGAIAIRYVSLDDSAHADKTRQKNARGLKFYARAFRKLGLECIPSSANFILVRVGEGQRVFNAMRRATTELTTPNCGSCAFRWGRRRRSRPSSSGWRRSRR